jgi:hypothetical protein
MGSLWFVVPAHGRVEVSRVAFAGLSWAIDELVAAGVDANAVVIASDENLRVAREHGFGTVDQANRPLGRKWNDGFEFAAAEGVHHVVPCGSDDWIHPSLILAADLDSTTVACTRSSSAVSEDGDRVAILDVSYPGGDGIRIWPTRLLAPLGYRPMLEDRDRAMDGAMRDRYRKATGGDPPWRYFESDPLWICDFKSTRQQLNGYAPLAKSFAAAELPDPFERLAEHYPAALVAMAERLYGRERVAA